MEEERKRRFMARVPCLPGFIFFLSFGVFFRANLFSLGFCIFGVLFLMLDEEFAFIGVSGENKRETGVQFP